MIISIKIGHFISTLELQDIIAKKRKDTHNIMTKSFSHSDITFTLEGITIHAPNIIFECFTHTIPFHSHGANCYEIHYIPAGYGTLQANDTCYEITPGTLYITGPYVEHAQTPLKNNPMQEYCVYIKFPKTPTPTTSTPVINLFTSKPFWFGRDTQGISDLMDDLFTEFTARHIGYKSQIEILLARLLILIARNYEINSPSHTTTLLRNQNTDVTLVIEEYFLYEYQNASLDELARRLNVSPRQIQRLMLEYYNKTFQQKKTDAKMSAAVILLREKEKSISAIADALGYSSPEHFSGAFKAYYQISPREYRKNSH